MKTNQGLLYSSKYKLHALWIEILALTASISVSCLASRSAEMSKKSGPEQSSAKFPSTESPAQHPRASPGGVVGTFLPGET